MTVLGADLGRDFLVDVGVVGDLGFGVNKLVIEVGWEESKMGRDSVRKRVVIVVEKVRNE